MRRPAANGTKLASTPTAVIRLPPDVSCARVLSISRTFYLII